MGDGSLDGKTLVIIEMIMTAGVCLGFGFYQLWSLKRDKKKVLIDEAEKKKESSL
jgi:hypothetical protein